jgi:hypothetical protein
VAAAGVAAAGVAGGGAFAALVNRDMEIIRRSAMVRVASGETVDAAVRAAQRDLSVDRGFVNNAGLAHVYFPLSRASAAEVTAGLRWLRAREIDAPLPPPDAGADAALAARQRRGAARAGVWINEGDRFTLVARGEGGAPERVATATLDEVLAASREQARRETDRPAVMRREDRLEQDRRQQRGGLVLQPQ